MRYEIPNETPAEKIRNKKARNINKILFITRVL